LDTSAKSKFVAGSQASRPRDQASISNHIEKRVRNLLLAAGFIPPRPGIDQQPHRKERRYESFSLRQSAPGRAAGCSYRISYFRGGIGLSPLPKRFHLNESGAAVAPGSTEAAEAEAEAVEK
jgi:hypothetical protein